MTREIILDTETTGISPAEGHRIVEIGAIELINLMPTGNFYHTYLNPERDMPKEAEAVHGLSGVFLADKPVFASAAQDFLTFIADSRLVIHNASFDMSFINAELSRIGETAIGMDRVLDTLALARRKHPMASNSLDALCRRYGVDNTKRSKHGALLDSELLAAVYLELLGGRQSALNLAENVNKPTRIGVASMPTPGAAQVRPVALKGRLTDEERFAHQQFIESLGTGSLWKS